MKEKIKYFFTNKSKPTVGIDFVSKNLHYDDKVVRLQIWDTAGQERFRALIPSYIRDSSAAVVVYDVGDEKSFADVDKWLDDVRKNRGQDAIVMLVANKIDIEERRVSKEDGENKAKEFDMHYMETSAATGENVANLFQVVGEILPTNNDDQLLSAASSSYPLKS